MRKRLGEILLEANMIDEAQLKSALEEQKQTKETLGQILVRLGYISEASIRDALELQFGINYINIRTLQIAPEVLRLIPEAVIRAQQIVPVNLINNRLTIAMVDPTNLPAIDDVRMRVKGVAVQAAVITEEDFHKVLDTYFPKAEVRVDSADEILGEMAVENVDTEEDPLQDSDLERASEDAPIIRLANSILVNAIRKKASDIHVEPQEHYLTIRYRIDGVLQKENQLPRKIQMALCSRYKIMANLDISEKRLPQDGRIRIRFNAKDIDFRVSTLPSKHGEKIVMRILDKSNTTLGLDKLFIYPDMLQVVRDMTQRPYGIIFVTGPTGSGKTTTLYSILAERNTEDVNISTAEDPIEYDLPGVTQCQAKPEIGMTFARILKAFLRQDPDIMLIGETRDKELAHIAIESALTGHLVFTSLHTNDAPGAITRLQEMGIDGFLIASATLGIIAQRLLRKLCPKCRVAYQPTYKELDFVGYPYKPGEILQFYKTSPAGCPECSNGYKGRMGVYEVLTMNDELRDLVNKNANKAMIRYAAKQNGMIPLKDYSLLLVRDGHTTLDEVIRVTLTDEGAETLCPNCRNPIGDEFVKCPFCQVDLKKLCPGCHRQVNDVWKSCPTCGHNLMATTKVLVTADHTECPTCLQKVEPDWKTCPNCETILTKGTE
ncbi:MAG: Flp pilus assembly complex ATPase component TadA [Candidatus Sericytochromatia bacterium]|nr:Flp pilus assembly complex ATPase component TadA [Candidatus Sericytochromatia bacterium]